MTRSDAGGDGRGSWRRWESGVIGAQPPEETEEPDPEGLIEVNFLAPEHRDKLATMLRWAAEGKPYEEVREEAESWLPDLLSPVRDQAEQDQAEPPDRDSDSREGTER